MFSSEFNRFQNPDVADLAWVIGSAPLMDSTSLENPFVILSEDWFDEQYAMHKDWLLELDKSPALLLSWIENHSQKLLGKRFEMLLSFWFSQSPHFELLQQNIVLHDAEKNTLGEIDFIVREIASNQIWHIESACKYYLAHTRSPSWENCKGPNGRDSLNLKMTKVKKQLSILKSQEGKDFLTICCLLKPIPVLLMKGYFFHHFSRLQGAIPPYNAHPHYSGGWYIYEHELHSLNGDLAQWILLPKERWMSPFRTNEPVNILSGNELIVQCREYIRKHAKAPIIVQIQELDGVKTEISRAFVVRETWPFLSLK